MIALLFLVLTIGTIPQTTSAQYPPEVEAAITAGVAWLAGNQEPDGSWPAYGSWDIATTGLALLKLEERGWELGYPLGPFDPAYAYAQNVQDGLDYLFTVLVPTDISPQDHTAGATGTVDDPDSNGNGLGLHTTSYVDVYETACALAAISASLTPTSVVGALGSAVDGWTYLTVAQDMVDWLAFAQSDADDPRWPATPAGEGGWSYRAMDNTGTGSGGYGPDNSNGGYAVLGLAYAIDLGCSLPQWVRTELGDYVVDIQDPVDGDANGWDGGSWYDHYRPTSSLAPNILKTGNLIFEMALSGVTGGVNDALDYLERHWGDDGGANQPPGWRDRPGVPYQQYQAMFTMMKGLEYAGITTFGTPAIDWYADISAEILAEQELNGSWLHSSGRGSGNPTILTAWALLTLERATPEVTTSITTHPVPLFTDAIVMLSIGLLLGTLAVLRRRK
jgi:hypothetical protein